MDLTLGDGVAVPMRWLNRHALITGATGTGKTVTLRSMAGQLARAGSTVLVMDAKGDISGRHVAPVFDLFTLGPDLICRALELSEAQSGAVFVLYAFAECEGIRLATLQDLRALCTIAAGRLDWISATYGLVGKATLAAVQRAALRLQHDAGAAFGRPGLDLANLGPGLNVMPCSGLARSPAAYGAAAAHVLCNLYNRAPEVGDIARPKWAVVIDEAHLVFSDCPPPVLRRLESVVRLIRSKGVALIFATQSPGDLPGGITGQIATRVQHGLRAVTPGQLRDVRAAAESMPGGTVEAIQGLGIGDALVSVPGAGGVPGLCQRIRIAPVFL